jgi:hypothetical protein
VPFNVSGGSVRGNPTRRRAPGVPSRPAPSPVARIVAPAIRRVSRSSHQAVRQTVAGPGQAARAVPRRERPVVRQLAAQAARRYAPGGITPAEQTAALSAFATGRVESQFQNLPYGDADSAGWRQERASIYPDPQNLKASIERYLSEAEQMYAGQSPGELAADVQRPLEIYRGRYTEVLPEARKLARLAGLARTIRAGT